MKKILVPIDGSHNSLEALKWARDMAEKYGSQIIILNIQKPVSYITPETISLREDPNLFAKIGEKVIDAGLEAIKGTTVEVKTEVNFGDPAEQILDVIDKEDVDVVVMGSQGITGIKKFLIGSVSNKILMHSSKPVMIIK
ncbi:MAG: universal stress protein [Firmicutes bacterium]|nr:universal stress protein [Bacillota bacterium]MCL5982026.1 universal stress protein [Bacillota bacterium]